MVTREKECENGGQIATVLRDDQPKSRLFLGQRKQTDLAQPQMDIGAGGAQKQHELFHRRKTCIWRPGHSNVVWTWLQLHPGLDAIG